MCQFIVIVSKCRHSILRLKLSLLLYLFGLRLLLLLIRVEFILFLFLWLTVFELHFVLLLHFECFLLLCRKGLNCLLRGLGLLVLGLFLVWGGWLGLLFGLNFVAYQWWLALLRYHWSWMGFIIPRNLWNHLPNQVSTALLSNSLPWLGLSRWSRTATVIFFTHIWRIVIRSLDLFINRLKTLFTFSLL